MAMLAGPPCESWSKARAVPLDQQHESTGMVQKHGPRKIRDLHELWGFSRATIRELQQLCVGNALLGFALLALLELALVDKFWHD